jgi:segregation and condensation protein B
MIEPDEDESLDLSASGRPAGDDHEDGISLEELGQAYAQAIARSDAQRPRREPKVVEESPREVSSPAEAESPAETPVVVPAAIRSQPTDAKSTLEAESEADGEPPPGPLAIIEAALFIGNPENRGIAETELATLMRDVSVEDVSRYVDALNRSYQTNGQALRIHRDEDGLRMGLSPEMEIVRRAFYGKIRESRLSQAAIEVLSLVAYQPGITAEKVQDQRGKESASLLGQLVRRRLLEQRRLPIPDSKRTSAAYFPTERFVQIFQLESLDDLPHVEA